MVRARQHQRLSWQLARRVAMVALAAALIVGLLPSADGAKASGDGAWLSGAGLAEAGNSHPAEWFASWRGSPVEIGQTWPDTPDVWGINPATANSWANWRGPMSLSFAPGSDWKGLTGWRNWSATARGNMDAWWRAAARKTATLRAGKGTTYVVPFYEFNGDWMAWSVPRTTRAYRDFRAGWKRVARIWRSEFPEARLVLAAACGRGVPARMLPAKAHYDVAACTIYNDWPWQASGRTALARLEAGRARAQAAGKPFAITEWANAGNPKDSGGGGDAPAFIAAMHAWMVAHAGTGAGELVFETYFNVSGYSADHQILDRNGRESRSQPRTAARYRQLW